VAPGKSPRGGRWGQKRTVNEKKRNRGITKNKNVKEIQENTAERMTKRGPHLTRHQTKRKKIRWKIIENKNQGGKRASSQNQAIHNEVKAGKKGPPLETDGGGKKFLKHEQEKKKRTRNSGAGHWGKMAKRETGLGGMSEVGTERDRGTGRRGGDWSENITR